jgi:hypothetical protein
MNASNVKLGIRTEYSIRSVEQHCKCTIVSTRHHGIREWLCKCTIVQKERFPNTEWHCKCTIVSIDAFGAIVLLRLWSYSLAPITLIGTIGNGIPNAQSCKMKSPQHRSCVLFAVMGVSPCPDHIDWHDRSWYQRLTPRLNRRVFNQSRPCSEGPTLGKRCCRSTKVAEAEVG